MANTISSINALAKLVDRSAPTVQRWVRREDWPFGQAPWPASKLKAIETWAENLQEDRNVEPAAGGKVEGGYQKAKTALTTAKAMREQLAYKRDKDEVHNVQECEQAQIERINFTKLALLTQVPSSAVQLIRARERSVQRPLADLEMAELIRQKIEDTIVTHLLKV